MRRLHVIEIGWNKHRNNKRTMKLNQGWIQDLVKGGGWLWLPQIYERTTVLSCDKGPQNLFKFLRLNMHSPTIPGTLWCHFRLLPYYKLYYFTLLYGFCCILLNFQFKFIWLTSNNLNYCKMISLNSTSVIVHRFKCFRQCWAEWGQIFFQSSWQNM